MAFMVVHIQNEALEQWQQVMRTRTGLGMSLEAENGTVFKLYSLQGAIEQRAMRRLHVLRQAVFIDREAMILARDHYPPRFQILDRVIRSMMAKLHLQCLGACCQSQQLMAQANAEHGNSDFNEVLDCCDRIAARFRIAGTI